MQPVEYSEVWLIPKDYAQDAIGQPIDIQKQCSAIPCEEYSITRTEWNSAQQGGYDADIQLNIFSDCYNGEKEAWYKGIRYTIYRTYRAGDTTELYLTQRVGDL